MAVEIKKAMCVQCKGECGVLVHVEDGRLIKATEDPDWPIKVWPATSGCARLRAAKEWFYHPQRLSYPLKRAGERGEGKWQRITWNQAFDEMAERLQKVIDKHGPESLCYTEGTTYKGEVSMRARFFNLLGNPINSSGAANVCFFPRNTMANTVVGMYPENSVSPKTKCTVLLGCEPLVSRPAVAHNLRQSLKDGGKLIVLDPRSTDSARMADVHLQLRPGTDCAVLMAMINVIINEELYDKPFVEKWCHGFDKIRERMAASTPEWAEKISEVPADKIRAAARLYATNRPGAMVEGMGIEESTNNGEILHCRWILPALVNNIDVEGGEELTGPHQQILGPGELEPRVPPLPEAQARKQIGSDRFRLLSWRGQRIVTNNLLKTWHKLPAREDISHGPSTMRAILTGKPYPVRACFTTGSNPMITSPNIKLVYKALKSLDLYIVLDHWMTPSAALADYVLPCASWMERPLLWDFSGFGRYMGAGEASLPKTIPGEYDHRLDYDLWREMGIRLGQKDYWPWKTLEAFYDARLAPLNMTHRQFVHEVRCQRKPNSWRKYEQMGFATTTGKIELYNTTLAQLDYDPLPVYREHGETRVSRPDLAREYPLTLITGGRIRGYYHSDFRQIESVRKLHPDPLMQLHPETASKLGIAEGDWAWMESPRGKCRMKVALFDGMKKDIVHAEHGWWLPELPEEEPWLHGVWESNSNVLLADDPDLCNPLTGAFPLKTNLCKVYKAPPPLGAAHPPGGAVRGACLKNPEKA